MSLVVDLQPHIRAFFPPNFVNVAPLSSRFLRGSFFFEDVEKSLLVRFELLAFFFPIPVRPHFTLNL